MAFFRLILPFLAFTLVACSGKSKVDTGFLGGVSYSLSNSTISFGGGAFFSTFGGGTQTNFSMINAGDPVRVVLTTRDQFGNVFVSPRALTVQFSANVTGSFSAVTDNHNGTYSAVFTPTGSGTLVVVATIDGASLTRSSDPVTVVPSGPPPAFAISSLAVNGAGTLRVTWGASLGTASFTVKYGTASGVYGSTASTNGASPLDITGLTPGQAYYVMVMAVNSQGSTDATTEASATPIASFNATSATGGTSQVTLVWPAVTGATGYDVVYGTSTGNYTNTLSNQGSGVAVTGLTGTYYFRIRAKNGAGYVSSTNELSAVALSNPVVSSVSPVDGVIGGGTALTITGTGFVSGASATVGGAACTSLTVVSATSITCTTPAHAVGAVSVVVTNSDSQSSTLASAYTYKTPALVVPVQSPMAFGNVLVNGTEEKTLYLTNTGQYNATGLSGGTISSPFAYKGASGYPGAGGTCGTSLAAGASCTVVLAYSPTSVGAGTYSGSVQFSYNNYAASTTATAYFNGGAGSAGTSVAEVIGGGGGGMFRCAKFYDGSLKCWGDNAYGQLGLGISSSRGDASGETGNSMPAMSFGTGRTVSAVATGRGTDFNCAILDDSSLKCWGSNSNGQLGLGDTSDRGDAANEMGDNLPAVGLGTGLTATKVSTGLTFACALLNNSKVKCWGSNNAGQLGQSLSTQRGDEANEMGDNLAVSDLGTGYTVTQIAAGGSFACAILTGGSVKCWGSNSSGQLGQGDTTNRGASASLMGDNLSAVVLGTGLTASQIAVGGSHVCAIVTGGLVKCWGSNTYGQLGLGDTTNRGDSSGQMGDNLPSVSLGTGRTALKISAGHAHTCAILDNGTVKCWGNNNIGQLGLEHTTIHGDGGGGMGNSLPTVSLGTGRTAKEISAGTTSTCAILDNDTIKCWGANTYGQLGLGNTSTKGSTSGTMGDSLAAVSLGTSRTALAISASSYSFCARLDNSSMKCWGSGRGGVLGNGEQAYIGDGASEMGSNLVAMSLGSGFTVKTASIGENFVCALSTAGAVKCWGLNSSGQLAIGATTIIGDTSGEMGASLAAASLGTGFTAVEIAVGQIHACAISTAGAVKCWGNNGSGRLGIGNTTSQGNNGSTVGDNLGFTALGTNRTAVQLALGAGFSCALLDNGTVKCWGNNTYGQLGRGDTASRGDAASQMGDNLDAIPLGTGRTAVQISAGLHYACALLDDGTVKCWGRNQVGQLGLGDTNDRGDGANEMGDNLPAVDFGSGRTAKRLSIAGNTHTCAILDDDSLKCWGGNTDGVLGQGDTSSRGSASGQMGDNLSAVGLGTGRKATQVSISAGTTCAVLDNEALKCWGNNDNGQLGLGDITNRGGSSGQMGDSLPAVSLQ